MTDFNSFRNAVLEDDDLQEQVISIINTATANGLGMGDGIATFAKTHDSWGFRTAKSRNFSWCSID